MPKKEIKKIPVKIQNTTSGAKAVDQAFAKLKAFFEAKKVDAWQEKWLAVPANRKKYEKLADAPEVVAEEALAIANDIIDFAQGEEGERSALFRKLKLSMGGFFTHPIEYLQKKAIKAKAVAEKPKKPATKKVKK